MWRFLLLLIVVAGGAAAYAYTDYQRYLDTSLPIADEHRSYTVEAGWSARRVVSDLASRAIIDKPHWAEVYVRTTPSATRIKSGEFELPAQATVPELLQLLVEGRTVQYGHTIIEGSNYKQLRERLRNAERLEQTLDSLDDAALLNALDSDATHPEGLFFADTYRFPRGTTDLQYLQRAYDAMQKVLDEEWEQRAPDLPLKTPYEALILASIVEKETAVAAERPLIAGVFHARLRKGMRLQTDPTVIYGMGDAFDGNIRRKDLTTDTPYNTYTRGGLPPTPIAMVGREAINAVLQPTETTKLYFVAKGDGTHQFSETLEQHNAAVRQYQLKK